MEQIEAKVLCRTVPRVRVFLLLLELSVNALGPKLLEITFKPHLGLEMRTERNIVSVLVLAVTLKMTYSSYR